MEQSVDGDSINKSRILDVKPLRCLVPVFPGPDSEKSRSIVKVSPTGPFPPGFSPFFPHLLSNEARRTGQPDPHTPNGFPGSSSLVNAIPSPVPLSAFRTPDGEHSNSSGRHKSRPQKRARKNLQLSSSSRFDDESLLSRLAVSFKLMEMDNFRKVNGDKDLVNCVLMVYDMLRRRITQCEEAMEVMARPNLRAGNLMMSKGFRTNNMKRIGHVPGIEVGDIFFFRMELCLVGLHAPIMAGIDYMSFKVSADEEPVALSIVSSGGYEGDGGDGDVLIYSGQGGVQRKDGQMFDQKLERGNLALEKSVRRGNEVRVIRGMKDVSAPTGKIYIYDGLYKIQESWSEKNKSSFTVFKYKLVRLPDQPEAFTLWKSIQQWKDGVSSRGGLILPDLTSGAEVLPVSLVNDVDGEKGPPYFTYVPTLKYVKPFSTPKPSLSCHCVRGCQPGDANCACIQRNRGYMPYTSLGVLLSYKSLIHECGMACPCPTNCRNRMTQTGLKLRLEVFRTEKKGWGLRSLDPIRAGAFICEYAGEIIDESQAGEFESENESSYVFYATRSYEPIEAVDGVHEPPKPPFPLVINAKSRGNVARFMNHSCSPNVFWRPVLRGNENEAYLHIAFFAIRHIPPLRELTYDYGMVPEEKEGCRKEKCFCGSPKCKGYFY